MAKSIINGTTLIFQVAFNAPPTANGYKSFTITDTLAGGLEFSSATMTYNSVTTALTNSGTDTDIELSFNNPNTTGAISGNTVTVRITAIVTDKDLIGTALDNTANVLVNGSSSMSTSGIMDTEDITAILDAPDVTGEASPRSSNATNSPVQINASFTNYDMTGTFAYGVMVTLNSGLVNADNTNGFTAVYDELGYPPVTNPQFHLDQLESGEYIITAAIPHDDNHKNTKILLNMSAKVGSSAVSDDLDNSVLLKVSSDDTLTDGTGTIISTEPIEPSKTIV